MNTNDIIRAFIMNEMLQRPLEAPLGDDDPLVESGIIDSLGIISLLTFLEEKFSLEIPSEDLIPENFTSISAITNLVDHQLIH